MIKPRVQSQIYCLIAVDLGKFLNIPEPQWYLLKWGHYSLEDYLIRLSKGIHARCLVQAQSTEGTRPMNSSYCYNSATGLKI